MPEYVREVEYFIVPVTAEQHAETLRIAHVLRDRGHSVAYALKEQGVSKQMKAATREGARTVLVVGPEELERGCVVARDMSTGAEHDVLIADVT